jgi:hypothetical protein
MNATFIHHEAGLDGDCEADFFYYYYGSTSLYKSPFRNMSYRSMVSKSDQENGHPTEWSELMQLKHVSTAAHHRSDHTYKNQGGRITLKLMVWPYLS